MLVDTHCHLADGAFRDDREQVRTRMHAAGVHRALVIESEIDQLNDTLSWVGRDPDLRLAAGCHPHHAADWTDDLERTFASAWEQPPVAAIGEIGLDYHYDHAPRDVQRDVFARQLAQAVERALPVIIHARDADDDVATILGAQPAATVILHSFTGSPLLLSAGLDLGWYFSFSGMVTFKSWTGQDAVRAVPADHLLVETDAPYLAPVPHRGKRNEPAWVVDVAARVAELRGVATRNIASATTGNADRLFWGH